MVKKKFCNKCKKEKFTSEFNKNKSKKDGLGANCKTCSGIASRKYYSENKEKHKKLVSKRKQEHKEFLRVKIIDYLKNNCCVDCGETNIVVLEFDHLRDKLRPISEMLANSFSWSNVEKEIKKCEVRCANCHKIKTAHAQGWYKTRL